MIRLTARPDYNVASVLIGCGQAWIASSAIVVGVYGAWNAGGSLLNGYTPTLWDAIVLCLMGFPAVVWGAAAYSLPYMLLIAAPTMLVCARWFGPSQRINAAMGGLLGLLASYFIPQAPYDLVSGTFLAISACTYGVMSGFYVTRTMYA